MQSPSVLDDFEEIRKIDKSDMLSFCVNASEHYAEALRMAKKISVNYASPKNIIVAGMGGSAICGELLKDYARETVPIPIDVNKEYLLPAYADKNSLVFIVSYSGETEESLSVLLEAVKRRCVIFCVSSGGKLLDFARKLSISHLQVPSGMPPRAALPYLFSPLIVTLEKMRLLTNTHREFSETVKILEKVSIENSLKKPLEDNFSKKLASNVGDTIPVIYGFGIYRSVAQRLKQQFNENSKVPAKWEFFPELNHNEIVGWEKAEKLGKHFSLIFVRDKNESEEINYRIEATNKILTRQPLKVFEVWSEGNGKLAKMFSTICIGDFASVYLALLRGVDPTPVKTITMLKERMQKSGIKEKILRELRKIAK